MSRLTSRFCHHNKIVTTASILSVLLVLTEAFLIPFSTNVHGRNVRVHRCVWDRRRPAALFAKNKNKNKKREQRLGGGQGTGRRGKRRGRGDATTEVDDAETTTSTSATMPAPSRLTQRIVRLRRGTSSSSSSSSVVRVCVTEVDDAAWWDDPRNDNPYGGRAWPSALGISEFLWRSVDLWRGRGVLEIGCGIGLVSIAAARAGARVVATDASPTALRLCELGWRETRTSSRTTPPKEIGGATGVDGEAVLGSLETRRLDLFDDAPLPIPESSSSSASSSDPPHRGETKRSAVIAGAMMYESALAIALARRAYEACERGAWVILGDDDTGEREGGRESFLSELDRIEKEKGVTFKKRWTDAVVRSETFRWTEKRVRILHINRPDDAAI